MTHSTEMPLELLVIGNCQASEMGKLISAMCPRVKVSSASVLPHMWSGVKAGQIDPASLKGDTQNLAELVASSHLIWLQHSDGVGDLFEQVFPGSRPRVTMFPLILFTAYHPDMIYVSSGSELVKGPMDHYQSSIALFGWNNKLSEQETLSLYAEDVYQHLGFFNHWKHSVQFLANQSKPTGMPVDQLVERWTRRGQWMHSINHPRSFVLADIARHLLQRVNLPFLPDVERFIPDELADQATWMVYPEVASRLGVDGHYLFKQARGACTPDRPLQMMSLQEFVRRSFESFARYPKDSLTSDRLMMPQFRELPSFLEQRTKPAQPDGVTQDQGGRRTPGANPYQDKPARQFWRRSFANTPVGQVDPVGPGKAPLNSSTLIATAGSCFAQHISQRLSLRGLNYYIAENGHGLGAEEARRRSFGVFSARYGNLYTARQLVQLLDRAYGTFVPQDKHWRRPDGQWVDPFRPLIEPDGFATIEAVEAAKEEHFACVRQMFESLDVFVFTLGLTEAWCSKVDGAVFPVAPGVAAGEFDPHTHEFVNFTVAEVLADMNRFVQQLSGINAKARIVLTVSPVPLVATYEDRHVLVSTTYSKSVLRAAAGELVRNNPACEYFPSYEVITGSYTRGQYFDEDLRSIKPEGVDHVMRLFFAHYAPDRPASQANDGGMEAEMAALGKILCEEEAIDEVRPG